MGSRRASPPAVLRNSRDVQASPDVRARPVSSRPTRGRDAGGRVDWKARCSEESESCDHACGDRQHSLLRSPRRNVGDSESSITRYTSMGERWESRGSRVLGTAYSGSSGADAPGSHQTPPLPGEIPPYTDAGILNPVPGSYGDVRVGGGLDEAALVCPARQLVSRRKLELAQDARHVRLNSLHR
jgi:hypothetical protein